MEIFDENGKSTGRGYNDWRYGTFDRRNDCDSAQFNAALHDMNIKTGERYAREIVGGGVYGAYMVNDPATPFYVVEWVGMPWKAEEDGDEEVSGHTYKWKKGDYLCRGNWLDRLAGTSGWYNWDAAHRQCIVKLDQVVNANIDMRVATDKHGDNPLPRRMPRRSREQAESGAAWLMSEVDWTFLLEEVQLREEHFEYDIDEASKILQLERTEEQWAAVCQRCDTDSEDE